MDVLVSNLDLWGELTDTTLVNPYGVLARGKYVWISSVKSSLVIKYEVRDGKCPKKVAEIMIPSPTGMTWGKKDTIYVASNTGAIYTLRSNDTKPTVYINIKRTPASVGGLAYHKGMLYVAVFSFGYVQVYDTTSTTPTEEVKGLVDDQLAEYGYVPIALTIECKTLYITYGNGSIVPGFGFVNSYNIKSGSLTRLVNRGVATYPYGIAVYEDKLYVANGSGYINVYTTCGRLVDSLRLGDIPFYSDGLRGITIECKKLYYVSANDNGKMGSLGVVSL